MTQAAAPPGDPSLLSIAELGAAFRARRLSPVEVTQRCLDRIARLDPELHAFITVTGEDALTQQLMAGIVAAVERNHDLGTDVVELVGKLAPVEASA